MTSILVKPLDEKTLKLRAEFLSTARIHVNFLVKSQEAVQQLSHLTIFSSSSQFVILRIYLRLCLIKDVEITTESLQICFRVEPTQLAFIILGASMAALALMILVVAILATGNTRHEVYRSSFGRTGGTVACMIFIFVTYVLLLCWLIVFACCIVMTVFYSLSWGVCNTDEIGWEDGFIDFYPYHFLFPSGKS